jgi:hypothetical protein
MSILWVAVADARGHLMRAHLARKLLGDVEIATTTQAGIDFLAELGTPARRLGRGYELAFDARQNLDRAETERRLLRYLLTDMLDDLRELPSDRLIVNDSLHPALLLAPVLRPSLSIVNLYGEHMLDAVAGHRTRMLAKSYGSSVRRLASLSFARIEHTLTRGALSDPDPLHFRLPPLIGRPSRSCEEVRASLGVTNRLAVVYLNPHFRDPSLAEAIERALSGFTVHAVGEGYVERGWRTADPDLTDVVAAADLVVSAPGMGTLAQVTTFGTPFAALVADQPEQRLNLKFLDPARTATVRHPDQLGPAIERLSSLPRIDRRSSVERQHEAWRQAFRRIMHAGFFDHRNEQPSRWWSERGATGRRIGAAVASSLEADSSALRAERARRHQSGDERFG